MKSINIFLFFFFLLFYFRLSAQVKVGDQPTVSKKVVALDVQGSNGLQGLWLPRVNDTSLTGIRALNPPNGLIIFHPPSGKLLLRSNNAWISYNSNAIDKIITGGQTLTGPAVTLDTGKSGTNFNLATNGNTVILNLPDASVGARGVVTNAAQSFGGAKTFVDGITVNNGSTLNNGTSVNDGLTVTGAIESTSNLTLGITSASTPTGVTSNVLSVDNAGKVVLTTTNIEANKPSRMLNYTLTITGVNLAANSTYNVNTPLPAGANVSFPASVYISPSTALANGTTVDWATILNNNLVANISTRGNSQNLNGYVFYVTIIDF